MDDSPVRPLVVDVVYPSRRYVLARLRAEGPSLALFAPTDRFVPLGSRVELRIRFADCDAAYELTGTVTFLRQQARGLSQDIGIGVTFDGEDKRAAAQMIAFCAGRPPDVGTAQTPRKELQLSCVVRLGQRAMSAEVRDLSSSGAFVAATSLPGVRVGSELVLQIAPLFSTFGGRRLEARVMWIGNKQGRAGFGARFLGAAGAIRPALKKFL